MKVSDLIDGHIPRLKDLAGPTSTQPRSGSTELASDRLDLHHVAIWRIAARLSTEGRSAMDGLLGSDPTLRQSHLHALISALDAEEPSADPTESRPPRDLFVALDRVLDAGSGGMANLFAVLQDMPARDQEAFLHTLANLLKRGVMGYEYRKVNGQPYKVFLTNEIGSDIHRAKLYRKDVDAFPGYLYA